MGLKIKTRKRSFDLKAATATALPGFGGAGDVRP